MPSSDWLAQLEEQTVRFVQRAPDFGTTDVATKAALMAALHMCIDDESRLLALAMERVLDDLEAAEIDPGIALPMLAMTAATLRQFIEPGSDENRQAARAHALSAARFELETLLPLRPVRKADVLLHELAPRKGNREADTETDGYHIFPGAVMFDSAAYFRDQRWDECATDDVPTREDVARLRERYARANAAFEQVTA